MGIAARDKGDADVELPGEVLLLHLVESSQQSPAAIIAMNADRAVDVTFIGSKRLTVERYQIVSVEHLRDDGRAQIEFATERTQKGEYFAIGSSERCAEVFRYSRNLPGGELRRKKSVFSLFLGKIGNEVC